MLQAVPHPDALSQNPNQAPTVFESRGHRHARSLGPRRSGTRKTESFVMITMQPNTTMLFAGSDEALAFLELKASDCPGERPRCSVSRFAP
jgi:hypothetical protein